MHASDAAAQGCIGNTANIYIEYQRTGLNYLRREIQHVTKSAPAQYRETQLINIPMTQCHFVLYMSVSYQ